MKRTRKLWLVGAVVAGTALAVAPQAVLAPQAQAKAYSQKVITVPHEGQVTAFTNGKTSFYIERSLKDRTPVLYKYSKGAEGPTQIKKLKRLVDSSGNELYGWDIANVRKGWIYLNWGAAERGFKGIYRMKTSGGKLKRIKGKANIRLAYGSNKYVAVTTRVHSDVSGEDHTLYKVGNGKLKKLKKIASHGSTLAVVGKKLYFTRSKDNSLGVTSLYRCSFTGKNIKRLGGPWKGAKYSWGSRGQAIVSSDSITSKQCNVIIYSKQNKYITYRYTYKTKKLVEE